MTRTTGYEYQMLDNNGTHDFSLCPDCRESLGFPIDPPQSYIVKKGKLTDSMYRQGTGGAQPCVGCGLDINNSLASLALRGKTDRSHVTVSPESMHTDMNVIATVIGKSDLDAFPTIQPGPGKADNKTFHVMVDNGGKDNPDPDPHDVMQERSEYVESILSANGMDTEILPPDPDSEYPEWSVIGA